MSKEDYKVNQAPILNHGVAVIMIFRTLKSLFSGKAHLHTIDSYFLRTAVIINTDLSSSKDS